MNFKPLGSRVLVKVVERREIKIAGQTLTVARGVNKHGRAKHEWEDEIVRALVVRVGELTTQVSEGDVVILGGAAGIHVDGNAVDSDQDHRMVHEDELIAIDLDATEINKEKQAVEKIQVDKEAIHV